jgi:hypothetical protein
MSYYDHSSGEEVMEFEGAAYEWRTPETDEERIARWTFFINSLRNELHGNPAIERNIVYRGFRGAWILGELSNLTIKLSLSTGHRTSIANLGTVRWKIEFSNRTKPYMGANSPGDAHWSSFYSIVQDLQEGLCDAIKKEVYGAENPIGPSRINTFTRIDQVQVRGSLNRQRKLRPGDTPEKIANFILDNARARLGWLNERAAVWGKEAKMNAGWLTSKGMAVTKGEPPKDCPPMLIFKKQNPTAYAKIYRIDLNAQGEESDEIVANIFARRLGGAA